MIAPARLWTRSWRLIRFGVLLRACIAPVLILTSITPLAGQTDSGTVIITVEEPMGRVGGALIRSEGRTGTTDGDGRARLVLPAGRRSLALTRIGYLPQEPFLFSGTIQDNLLLTEPCVGPSPPQERAVAMATSIAALGHDLQALPAALQTEIGELGIRVSGGQRQRIALARALAAPPALGLLVLDDPFSAVDIATEAQIIAALRAAFGPTGSFEQRATIVLCSHRLAAFPQADWVVVLDAGRIVEQGTHAGLLAADGLYARIYHAQQRVVHPQPTEVPT